MRKLITYVAAAIALGATPSYAADIWRGLSFGMTRAAVRAASGLQWSAEQEIIPDDVFIKSSAPLMLDGEPYEVTLTFMPADHLHEIRLRHDFPAVAVEPCRATFEQVLARLESTYGALSPRPLAAHESTVETRQVPGRSSSYAMVDKDLGNIPSAQSSGSILKFAAMRKLNGYSLHADTVWTRNQKQCTSVSYWFIED